MNPIDRILDANLNRAREGLRVVEEAARLVLENTSLLRRIKAVRHELILAEKKIPQANLIASRAVRRDPGATYTTPSETRKKDLQTLVQANLRRVEEALRVLEEVSKLKGGAAPKIFKKIRFQTYDLEYDIVHKMTAIRKIKKD